MEVGALLRLPRFAGVSEEEVRSVVDADPKGRFALRPDPLRIRANQGHSLQVGGRIWASLGGDVGPGGVGIGVSERIGVPGGGMVGGGVLRGLLGSVWDVVMAAMDLGIPGGNFEGSCGGSGVLGEVWWGGGVSG